MKKRIIKEIGRKLHFLVILALLADFLLPKTVSAKNPSLKNINSIRIDKQYSEVIFSKNLAVKATRNNFIDEIKLPKANDLQPKKTMKLTITAYSSTVDQTDASPCITANGFNVCKHNRENVIAANFLPFGSKVKIPELYGDRVFTVQDRMNKRYWYQADIWMKSRESAKQFGVKYTKVEIF